MKRILLALAIVGLVCSSAHAVTRYTYNPLGHKDVPVRIVRTVPNGPQVSVRTSYSVFFENDGGCLRLVLATTQYTRTVVYSYGTVTSDDTASQEVDRQVIVEVCP